MNIICHFLRVEILYPYTIPAIQIPPTEAWIPCQKIRGSIQFNIEAGKMRNRGGLDHFNIIMDTDCTGSIRLQNILNYLDFPHKKISRPHKNIVDIENNYWKLRKPIYSKTPHAQHSKSKKPGLIKLRVLNVLLATSNRFGVANWNSI
jgi:hypothetical protein